MASRIRTASLIAGKQANLTIHMGDEKQALELVFNILEKADIPISLFQPTHCTRIPHLFEQAIKFTHLVYSFDPNLPLNRELVDLPNKCKGCIIKTFPQENDVFKNFLFLLKCFTDYLETFHD